MSSSTTYPDRRRTGRGRLSGVADALYSLVRFLARHVRGFFGPLLAFLGLGFLVGMLAVILFGLIARSVAGGLTQSFDERALLWLENQRTPILDAVALEVTMLGSGAVVATIVAVSAVFLFLTRHRVSMLLLLIGTFGGMILNATLKEFFDRPRPSVVEWVGHASSASFPSGHAMTAMIAYSTVAYLVGRLEPTARLRRTTWVIAGVLIIAIGLTRLYLGVHYPSDVIAGFLAGLAWLTIVAWTLKAVQMLARRNPQVATEERDLNAESERARGLRA